MIILNLSEPTSIEFIHMIFESDDGFNTYDFPAHYEHNAKCLNDAESRISNAYSRGFSLYLSNKQSIDDEAVLIHQD